jgi:hypothetical protein
LGVQLGADYRYGTGKPKTPSPLEIHRLKSDARKQDIGSIKRSLPNRFYHLPVIPEEMHISNLDIQCSWADQPIASETLRLDRPIRSPRLFYTSEASYLGIGC